MTNRMTAYIEDEPPAEMVMADECDTPRRNSAMTQDECDGENAALILAEDERDTIGDMLGRKGWVSRDGMNYTHPATLPGPDGKRAGLLLRLDYCRGDWAVQVLPVKV